MTTIAPGATMDSLADKGEVLTDVGEPFVGPT